MKYKIILCTALLLAAGFSAPAHGPYDCWGYSEKKPGLYCVIPGPHGERPGMDRYSRSVVLVSVDGDMKRKDMKKYAGNMTCPFSMNIKISPCMPCRRMEIEGTGK